MHLNLSRETIMINLTRGWGLKFSGKRAKFFSRLLKVSPEFLEDGFISYVDRNFKALSVVSDRRSIYYNAYNETDLDLLIKASDSNNQYSTDKLIRLYTESNVSKYNSEKDFIGVLPSKYILVIDQVNGDLSVKYGMANHASFKQMLKAALEDFPNHKVIIKIHPDINIRKKRGYFILKDIAKNPRIQIIAENCHPIRLITEADAVYTVTSQVGFEALIHGKMVKCFGMPFYAGWGLTEDVLPAPKRRGNVSLSQLIYAALIKYPIYRDPETDKRTTVYKTIEYIGFQRMMRARFPTIIYAYGFSSWKKPILQSFTQGSKLIFINKFEDAPFNSTLIVWGSLSCDKLDKSIKVIRVEDGFLRSVGLGGDLICPHSWVFDELGIYYDSSKISQLESILSKIDLKAKELKRSKLLMRKIVNHQISKYNLGSTQWNIESHGRTKILVVGQVENDASIRYGTGKINTNIKLLKVVRKNFPKAFIIFKPHPDVVAGIRKKGSCEMLEQKFYNMKIDSGDAVALFDIVDSVHTMTSLVGFEALLRNKKVYTYGQPFYSSWGLTIDAMKVERRRAKIVFGRTSFRLLD